MKNVTAVVKPFKLDGVRDALANMGIRGITVSEIRAFGREKGASEIYRGAEYAIDFLPKVKIEVIVTDELAEDVAAAIMGAALTGRIGDGYITVSTVETYIKIEALPAETAKA